MVNCNKCGNNLSDDSAFCSKCGTKVDTGNAKITIKIPKKKLLFGIAGLVIVVSFTIVFFLNRPVNAFLNAVQDNEYGNAIDIYNKEIKGNSEKENEIKTLLKEEIDNIKNEYVSEKIQYEPAITQLDTIYKTNLLQAEVNVAKGKINDLNNSRTAFKAGQELLKNDQVKDALTELKKVVKEDSNYQKAKELIDSSIGKYKAQILEDVEQFAAQQKYQEAVSLLTEALSIIPNDADFSSKKTVYQKQNEQKLAAERKKKMEELLAKQEVSVVSTSLFTDWLDDKHISIVVKNHSNKVVKKYEVGWMGFDKNGYPVKTGWLSPDFLKVGSAEANIQPGNTFGSDSGWQLTGGYSKTLEAVKFIACVKEVEYYDGSKWTNPYYQYWLEEYKEKPFK